MNNKGNFDDFKAATRMRRLNLWVQIILGVILYAGLNFLAARHYQRWDFSENSGNSLSPESMAYVKNLSAPVEVYAIVSRGENDASSASIIRDIRAILKQYQYLSKKNAKISFEFVNPHIENKKAERLASRFGADLEDCVVVASGAKFKRIPIVDFYETVAGRREFKGEALLSSAILNSSSGKDTKIYFLKGHGEQSFKNSDMSRGLSEFGVALSSRNYKLFELDLNEAKAVPKDCELLVIAGARAAFLPREIDAIKKYLLNANGRVVIFLDMGGLFGLEDILWDWGIRSDDMLILDSSGDFESGSGDLIARSFPQKPHPIVKYLIDADMPVQFGSVRPVRPDMGSPVDDTLKLDPIILSGKSSWAEKNYAKGGEQRYDESSDLSGPLPLGMIASRTGGMELGLKIPGGKLAVFGDENFIANKWFNRLGNSKLALNTIGWMFEENNMLNIPPRALKTYTLTLSQNEMAGLGLRFFALAFFVLLTGIFVSFMRRR